MTSRFAAAAAAMAIAWPACAQDAEIVRIRAELQQMKENYERRIKALEQKLDAAQSGAARVAAPGPEDRSGIGPGARFDSNADASAGAAPSPGSISTVDSNGISGNESTNAAAGSASTTAFNPAISLILQGAYTRTSQDPARFQITGFIPPGETELPKRGFSLGETELVFSANVDPYFRGLAIASLTPQNDVEVEEAVFETLALPYGLTLKGGRFLSGIGYQNAIHAHAWDFQDAPLAYQAFLGGRLQQEGLQVRWLAPTPIFLELGAEASSGDRFPGSARSSNGIGGSAIFAHVGDDIGESYAWRAGVSYVRAKANDRAYDDLDSAGGSVVNRFSGNAKLWVADAVLKWAPDGNSTRTNFKLQGEYMRLRQDGRLTYDDNAGRAVFGELNDAFSTQQSGWYLQGVWQFMPRWRVGYRYDRLRYGTVDNAIVGNARGPSSADFPLLAPYDPTRNSVMLDFSPTEFSRLRLQLAADRSRIGVTDHQIVLQYILSLGAHGAHGF